MSNPPFKRLWPLVALALLGVTMLLWWQSRPKTPPPAPAKSSPARAPTPPPPVTPNPGPDGRSTSGQASVAVTPPGPDPYTQLNAALALQDPQFRAREFGRLLQAEI